MKKFAERTKILEVLHLLDEHCQSVDTKAELILLGGAAIFLFLDSHGIYFRPTEDIDLNIIKSTDFTRIHEVLRANNIDVVGGVMELPPMEDFIDGEKFEIHSNFKNVKIYVPSIELLACSKIFSIREKDLFDLKNSDMLNLCDINKLMDMINEYKDYCLNLHNKDLNLFELQCILKEKGIF